MKTHNENYNSALSLGMLQKQLRLLFIFVICSPMVALSQDAVVFVYDNPFYEDCRLVDIHTHAYIKASGTRYLEKMVKSGNSTTRIVAYYYNDRATLDSVIDSDGSDSYKLTIYTYDSLSRLIAKIDSFKTNSGWDSVYHKTWTYRINGNVDRIDEGWSYFDQPYQRLTLLPTIVYDTLIGDMARYKRVGPLVGLDGSPFPDPNPSYLWLRDGKLVLKGTETVYSSMTISDLGEEQEIRYNLYRGDSATLMRISRYDLNWQLKASKVYYKEEWVLLEDHRYDRNGYELMNTKSYPISGIKSTTTFIRDQTNGKIERELSPVTYDSKGGGPPRITVAEVTYTYSAETK